jgi:glycosyltransferase involved in cell wall biosynthesis
MQRRNWRSVAGRIVARVSEISKTSPGRGLRARRAVEQAVSSVLADGERLSSRAGSRVRGGAILAARAAFWPVYACWAALYLGVNAITRGNLDWLMRVRYRWVGWAGVAVAAAPDADFWHGHDLNGLVAAMRGHARNGAPVIYDSHEVLLESSTYVTRPRWTALVLRRIERRWVRRCAALVTVNDGVARELVRRYRPRRTVVVHNCPIAERTEVVVREPVDRLRAMTGIPAAAPIAIYHGLLVAHRGVEQLAEALLRPELKDVHGVLLGYGAMRDEYEALARTAQFEGRLHVVEAVSPYELVAILRTASVALMPIQASTLNHYLSTPNKLFEALAAGLPVVASDFPAMRAILLDPRYGPLGCVCNPNDVVAIASAIRSLLDLPQGEQRAMRSRARAAVRDRWNWQSESRRLVDLYRSVSTEFEGARAA